MYKQRNKIGLLTKHRIARKTGVREIYDFN